MKKPESNTELLVVALRVIVVTILIVLLAIWADQVLASEDSPGPASNLAGRGVRGVRVLNYFKPERVESTAVRDKDNPYVVHCIPGSDINGDGEDDFCTRSKPKVRP